MYTVLLTDQAETDLDRIVSFIGENWSASIKTEFLASVSDKLQRLERNPFIYRASKTETTVRECTINRFVAMFYRITESNQLIEIL
ncbi:MAG: type II toxin-antitoxin system RelE/ParE family toxin [Rudanella sp.]|nr:type II toxin-antitoxin system RelE/ParE family toxin [Rudanella sp.]